MRFLEDSFSYIALYDCFRPGLSIADVSDILGERFPCYWGWDLFSRECYSCPLLFYWIIGPKHQVHYHKWILDKKTLQNIGCEKFEKFQSIMRQVSAQLINIRTDPIKYFSYKSTYGNIYDQLKNLMDCGNGLVFKRHFPNMTNILNRCDVYYVNRLFSCHSVIPPKGDLSTLSAGGIQLSRDITTVILNMLRICGPKTLHKCARVCRSWRLWLYYV